MGIILPRQIEIRNKRDVSPLFLLRLPSNLNAQEVYHFDLEKKPYSKYLPFNYLYVANRSNVEVIVIINDTIQKKISPNTIEQFESDVIPAIWKISVKNNDTTNALDLNDLEILIQKQKTFKMILDKWVLRL